HQQAAATAPRPRAVGSPRVGPATAAEQAPPRAASHAHGYFSLLLKTVSSDLVSPLLTPLVPLLAAAWQRLEQATQQALPGVADATSSRRPSPSGVGWEIEQAPDECPLIGSQPGPCGGGDTTLSVTMRTRSKRYANCAFDEEAHPCRWSASVEGGGECSSAGWVFPNRGKQVPRRGAGPSRFA